MKVTCDLEHITLTNAQGNEVESVEVTCNRCGHAVQSFGTEEASIKRCLALLNEECPEGEDNYYDIAASAGAI